MIFAIHHPELATGICVSAGHWTPLPSPTHPNPLDFPRAISLCTLFHASYLYWSCFNMIMYMFRCYSLKSFHSRLLPLSPKGSSLHLCLFCCPSCRLLYGTTVTSYMTTGKTIALSMQTVLGKVMSFSFMAAITVHSDFEGQGNKVCHCFHYFPIYFPWGDGTGCHDLCFLNAEF